MLRRFATPVLFSLVALASLASMGCFGPDDSVVLQGAGATFPAPVYKRWFLEYHRRKPNVRVSYQPIGSGAGVRQFSSGLVDFGASDSAMSDKELEEAKKANIDVLMLPVTAGSVAVAYNLPTFDGELKISRKNLARIFLGEIDVWNHADLKADNPGIELPNLSIVVVRRAESSGTTFAFSNHLASASAEWKKEVGASKTVDKWKTGIGARGNSGVAATLQQTAGAIGYLETGYAMLSGLPVASLENKSGRYHKPTPEAGQAALEGEKLPDNLRLFLPDPKGANAYPIVTYTWLLCSKNPKNPNMVEPFKQLVRFALDDGQVWAKDLGYIPLPKPVIERVLQALDTISP